jgi:hypothetical protein
MNPMPKISELSQVLRLLEKGKVSEIGISNRVELSKIINRIKNKSAPLILEESRSCHSMMLMLFGFYVCFN